MHAVRGMWELNSPDMSQAGNRLRYRDQAQKSTFPSSVPFTRLRSLRDTIDAVEGYDPDPQSQRGYQVRLIP